MAKRILIISSSPRRKGNSVHCVMSLCVVLLKQATKWKRFFYATKELSIAPVAVHAVF